jgi:hypothetical protein
MAITFPASPTAGATYTNPTTGVQYIYNATDGVWKTYVWPTNTNYLQLTGGTLTGDLALGTNDLTAQDITSTTLTTSTLTTTGAITPGANIVMASGNGIDFSATANSSGSMTSELLDDYEEGTFLPTMFGSTVAGSTTYSLQYGYYVKVGKLVHIQIRMSVTATTALGNMYIGGLPFVALNDSDKGYASVTVSYASNLTMTSGTGWVGAYTKQNDSYMAMINNIPGGSIVNTSVDSSFTALMGGTYASNV